MGGPFAQMHSPCASSTVRSIVRKQDFSTRGLHALESAPVGEHATFPGVQRRDARSAQLQLPAPRRSYLTRHRSVNNLPEVKVDNTVVAVLQRRRAERSQLERWRIQLAAEARSQWRSYQRALEQKPLRTKALTSFYGLVLADVIAQAADPGSYDVMRTARMGAFGLAWHGVSGHFWYEMLDRVVMPTRPKATSAILAKMIADQVIWSPLNTCIFYASLAVMEGHGADVPTILHDKLLATVVAGYCLWPLAHIVNFKFVPPRNRLLYINVVNLFWSIFLVRQAAAPAAVLHEAPSALPITPIPVSNTAPPPVHSHTA